ncbi:MAG: phosphoribosylformylglycinamidine synthase subunit PurL [Candidatus Levybacteria bacterium]|nr:phosphoribosylformylglycinamidine synthase subunit PurL [Candidatus Levybacteria bacterium]
MVHTIRVQTVKGPDLLGEGVLSDIQHFLHNTDVKKIQTTKVYRVEGIEKAQVKILAQTLFAESINQKYSIDTPLITDAREVIEIAYKPGVMNPEVASILKAANDLGIKLLAADTSREYGFYGSVNKEKTIDIITKLNLYNKLVEHIVTENPKTLVIKGSVGKTETIPLRDMSDDELLTLSKDKLFLNLEEIKVIQTYFSHLKRDPTDCEIETIAQTWSEHSGHKTFKAALTVDGNSKMPFIKRIQKEAWKHKKHIVSAFVDNSGVMDFYDGYAICGKAETHNSPSAIEPYGGAMTGSGGVFRDVMATGQGAKTLVSTDVFCLAPPDLSSETLPPGCLPPRYILKRVVAAVRDYGNRIGIPTNNGSFHFHDDFRAKPTVLVGAYGILPKKTAQIGKPKPGDVVISIGGRVGRDGIHGATFSSAEMTERTINVNAQAVQIGNAIEEKRVADLILEARDKNLIRAIQDSGGGGLSSAVGEIGATTGIRVHLEHERLKYPGLSPWEIWVAESQERMVLAIPKDKIKAFQTVAKKYNVEVSLLGEFTKTKKLEVLYKKEVVCNLDMEFLHHGLPQRQMTAKRITNYELRIKGREPKGPKTEKEWITTVEKILSHGNVCSKEPIVRMYDHSVQGTSIVAPYSGEKMDGPNDAAVIRPLLNKPYGMIVSHGINPILNNIDPYWGSIWAGVEALSNLVAVGGNYKETSLINNYVWPFPDEESLWTLDRSVDAVIDLMKTFGTPVISGKDSLSSTYRGKDGMVLKIPPVLGIAAFGRIKDIQKTQTTDFKKTDSVICLVGRPDDSLGGSIYYDINKTLGTSVPKADLQKLPQLFNSIYKGIGNGKILSCHDVSEGGIITTIFEMCVGGEMGATITLKEKNPEKLLFNETAGCFVVEVANERVAKGLFKGIPYMVMGKTQKEKTIEVKNLFSVKLEDLKMAWQKPMKELFS